MLKFFRRYNKIILVVGAAFLMVAFLVQGTVSMFLGGVADRTLGTVSGQEITTAHQRSAAQELRLLQLYFPPLGRLANNLAEGNGLKWILMRRDAHRLGLAVSRAEVNMVLDAVEQATGTTAAAFAQRHRVGEGAVRRAIGDWLLLEQYRRLILGQGFDRSSAGRPPALQRLMMVSLAQQVIQKARSGDNPLARRMAIMQASRAMSRAEGGPRLSEPVLAHLLSRLSARAAGKAVLIPAARLLDQVPAPPEQAVRELFRKHRDDLPGQGEPYGFGYRQPDRVRVGYLAFPLDQISRQVQVEEAEAMSWYQQHREQFKAPPTQPPSGQTDGARPIQPYRRVRERVITRLREQKARELARRMARAGIRLLRQHDQASSPREPASPGSADQTGPSLQAVQQQLAQRFEVMPEVHPADEQWVGVPGLASLPGIGRSHLAGRPEAGFIEYIRSARQLNPAGENSLTALGLEVGKVGEPLVGPDGSRFVFRLAGAAPARSPERLEPVRERVTRDARRLAAYRRLLKQRPRWVQRAKEQGLAPLAQSLGQSVLDVPPTRRRTVRAGGELTVPRIPGIGRSEAFIDQLFQVAEKASHHGRRALSKAPADARIGIAGVDGQLALAVLRADEYQGMTHQEFERQIASQAGGIGRLLFAGTRRQALSFETIAQRVGYEPAEGESAPAGSSSSPQQAGT